MSNGIKFAITSAAVQTKDGRSFFVAAGQPWAAGDEVVLTYPHFFADAPRGGIAHSRLPEQPDEVVEVADAKPGVKRATKKAAARKTDD
jgi:hypothetical protein